MHALKKYILLMMCVAPLCFLAGCVDVTVRSAWKDREIVIDGKDADWGAPTVDQRSIAFGVCNDAENLYVRLSITDKMTKAQMLGLFKQDFYLWFDSRDRKMKTCGLKFSNNSSFMNEELIAKMRYLPVHVFQVVADEMMKNLSITVVQNYFPVGPLAAAKGIDVGIGMAKDGRQLIYELKIPLAKTAEHPFAFDAVPGKPIYIGLETSPVDMVGMRHQLGLVDLNDMANVPGSDRSDPRMRRAVPINGINELEAEIALERFSPVQVWGKVILAKKS